MLVAEKDIKDTIKNCSYEELSRLEIAILGEKEKRDKEAKRLCVERIVDALNDGKDALGEELFYNTDGDFRFSFEEVYECIASKLIELA